MKTFLSITQRLSAIIAGTSIIVMTFAAVIATNFTIGKLVVESNSIETFKNILDSKTSFNVGIFSWLIILISDVFATWGLYLFFKPTSNNLSLLTAWFRISYVAMLAVSIFNLVYVHLLIHQPGLFSVDSTDQLSEMVMFYLNSFDAMFSVSLIVFSIHILFLGYLSFKSEHIPKLFGIVLIIAFAGYMIVNTSKLVFPEYKDLIQLLENILLLPLLGEVALGVWLVFIGFRKINK